MPGKRRSTGRGTTGTPSAKRPKTKWSGTKFGQTLEGAGLILGGDKENLLTVEPAMFQRQLANALRKTSTAASGVDDFLRGLRDYLDSPTRFRTSLLPTNIAEGADIRARFGGLDSLMRLLMGVDVLQVPVIDVLLEWLPDYMSDGGGMDGIELQEYLQMPKLMLSQLRWLDHLVNGQDLCDKLLEVVEIASPEMQREIIVALPEILDDPQHNDVAQKLKSILEVNTNLIAAIVDALSNLNIAAGIAGEVLDTAINSLESADINDLPTVMKFINENMTPRNAQEVVSEIREKLKLDFSPIPIISSTPFSHNKQTSKTSDYFVLLDTIRSSICFQKPVADGWIKAISSVADHRVIDIFVLFVLHSISAHRKAVEKLFSNKIKVGCFSDELMNSVFSSNPGALRDFFPSLLQLCEVLLCSSSPTVSVFAVSLYQHLFTSFNDIYCQQEVVDALVIHINNGMRSEVDHALDVILALLKYHCKTILRFTPLIKTVLDYLGHLTIPQIRKLYQVLGILAFTELDDNSSLQSELHNILRKQLNHFEPRYRHIGVIGSIMTIQQIARRSDECDMSIRSSQTSSSQDSITGHRHQMALTMLKEVMDMCSHSQECYILFCDEMCSIATELDRSILTYLCESVTGTFQDTFLVEASEGAPDETGGVSVDLLYGLDDTEEGSIALNLLPMVVHSRVNPDSSLVTKGEGLFGMAAQFHLLRICEQQLNNNLEAVDALLGCPVLMCSEKVFNGDLFENLPEVQRMDVCLSIFYCINWFRELVCAFARETDVEMKGKVLIRLRNITDLQDRLETCMTATPGFWPPFISTSEEVGASHGRGKSTKGDVTLASMTAATMNIDKDSTAMEKISTPSVPIDRLRPYFRELDLSIFKVFHFGCLSRTILDSEFQTKEQEELRLQPPQLIFLLQDLCHKLTTSFSVFGPKVSKSESAQSFLVGDLVSTMKNLLPGLCEHLETTSSFFQAQLVENDGILDAAANGADYPQYCLCFHLILKALSIFFAWPSLSDPLYLDALKSCLVTINSRTGHTSSQIPSSLVQMAHGACKYLQKFSEFLPTLTCGHALAKVMVAICKTCKAVDVRSSISRACGSLLQSSWKAAESTQLRNTALTFLLKYQIEWASEPLAVVESLACDATVELMGEEAKAESSKYPTLSTATFPWFYRAMMLCTVNQLKAIPVARKGTSRDSQDLMDSLYILQVSAKVFSILVNLVQSFTKRTVMSTLLKVGKAYIEAFIKHGMPIMDTLFRPQKDDVIALLKTVQQSTRYLQHCCSHSKVAKDSNLINHVPHLKRALEKLLFRVKELMVNHNCQEAFWVGNLKNRDLKGQEILSQDPSQASQTSNENEAERRESEEEIESATTSTDTKSREDELLDLDSEIDDDF